MRTTMPRSSSATLQHRNTRSGSIRAKLSRTCCSNSGEGSVMGPTTGVSGAGPRTSDMKTQRESRVRCTPRVSAIHSYGNDSNQTQDRQHQKCEREDALDPVTADQDWEQGHDCGYREAAQ